MDIKFHDKLYRLPQRPYDGIEYSARLCCPNCADNPGYRWMDEMASDEVVGCTEVNGEMQIIKRCKYCGELYRFHLSKRYNEDFSFDLDAWKFDVGTHLYVNNHSYLEVNG